mmetsp:Transcript_3583/g.9495  ORF Transcript_3583/g.9495 Transcript_3583/m.9495 type:complete len:97 (+) Transcript_3583:489-779(+)
MRFLNLASWLAAALSSFAFRWVGWDLSRWFFSFFEHSATAPTAERPHNCDILGHSVEWQRIGQRRNSTNTPAVDQLAFCGVTVPIYRSREACLLSP